MDLKRSEFEKKEGGWKEEGEIPGWKKDPESAEKSWRWGICGDKSRETARNHTSSIQELLQ